VLLLELRRFLLRNNMTDKDIILRQLVSTSDTIANKFDELYKDELDLLAQELATSYNILTKAMVEKENPLSDNDFQSANLYWTALNTILAAIDLLRRGYLKEPQMLIRNALETFAVAYDFHENPDHYRSFIANPKKFESTKSISVIKKVHGFIGQLYGQLSSQFTHISGLHVLPHKHDEHGFYMGGRLDPNDLTIINMEINSIIATLDILNSVLELSFISYVDNPRFWVKIDSDTIRYTPNKERVNQVMNAFKTSLESLDKEPQG